MAKKKKPARKPVAAKRPAKGSAAGGKAVGKKRAAAVAKPSVARNATRRTGGDKKKGGSGPAATKPSSPTSRVARSSGTAGKSRDPSWPRVGAPAPDFTVMDHDGSPVRLSSFRGRPVVLYFYPKDDTPGCTIEACGFRDAHAKFGRHATVVLGISPDGPRSHAKFRGKYGLPFSLLADENHAVAELYGAWREKSMYGKRYMGIARSTFVIDAVGRIARVFTAVKPQGHDQEVLSAIAALE